MWVLRIGKRPLSWFKAEAAGNIPCPRYGHSMDMYEPGNFLIVHGGRNDFSSDSFALSDTYIFELNRFEWMKIELFFDSPKNRVFNRTGHSSIVYSNFILIFFIILF